MDEVGKRGLPLRRCLSFSEVCSNNLVEHNRLVTLIFKYLQCDYFGHNRVRLIEMVGFEFGGIIVPYT